MTLHKHEPKTADDVFSFWKKWENICTWGSLARIFEIVATLNPSEASVERGFSSLGHVITRKRNRMTKEAMESQAILYHNSRARKRHLKRNEDEQRFFVPPKVLTRAGNYSMIRSKTMWQRRTNHSIAD
jgi:hypothetical protein